jgi:5-hydroxyisourate hydrolase
MTVSLFIVSEGGSRLLKTLPTNVDGRMDEALLEGEELQAGTYELVFEVGNYFAKAGGAAGEMHCGFLGQVPVRFRIDDPDEHVHVPLLAAPGGYSTYRGS